MSRPRSRYAVFGHPIGHSRSPAIHTEFARQTGQAMRYEAIDPGPDGFEAALRRFFGQQAGQGANVTLPFKEAAHELADRLTDRARLAGAVNTLKRLEDGQLLGDNTDGAGLLRDLQHNLGLALQGRRILLLGAGGAARGVIAPLLEAGPDMLHIANRRPDKAEALARRFQSLGRLGSGDLERFPDGGFDLVIHATAASVRGQALTLPDGLLKAGGLGYDMSYAREATPFTRWAEQQGARASDGWGMLVEQAAESFRLWHGLQPETAALIRGRPD